MLWEKRPEEYKKENFLYLKNFYDWLEKYLSKAGVDGKIDGKIVNDLLYSGVFKKRGEELRKSAERLRKNKGNYFKNEKEFKRFIEIAHKHEEGLQRYIKALELYRIREMAEKFEKKPWPWEEEKLVGISPQEFAAMIQEAGKPYEKEILSILESNYTAVHTPEIDDQMGTGDIYLWLNPNLILSIDVMVTEDPKFVKNIVDERRLKYLGFKEDYTLNFEDKMKRYLSHENNEFMNDLKNIANSKDEDPTIFIKSVLNFLGRINVEEFIEKRGIKELLEYLEKNGYKEISDLIKKKWFDGFISILGNYQASVNPTTFLMGNIDNKVYRVLTVFTEKEMEDLKTKPKDEQVKYLIEKIKNSINDFKNFAKSTYLYLLKNKEKVIDLVFSKDQKEFNLSKDLENFNIDDFIKELNNKAKSEDRKEASKAQNILNKINNIDKFWNQAILSL
ncbi:MAG: hypothetical protein ACP5JU_01160 [Minisyncoccia bacterium]